MRSKRILPVEADPPSANESAGCHAFADTVQAQATGEDTAKACAPPLSQRYPVKRIALHRDLGAV